MATETAPPEAERPLLRDARLYVVFSVTLMAVLGVSSIAPALPRMSEALGVGPDRIGLLITAFTVPGVFLTPLAGILADRIGRRPILVPALVLFALAGGACAFVRDFELLVALRFVQGMGAAPIGALNLTVMGDLFEGERRAAAMGYNSSVLSVGTASYPALGGALALLGWWAPFYLPFLALPVALAVLKILPTGRPERVQTIGRYLAGVARWAREPRVATLFGVSLVTFILLYGAILTWFPLLIDQRFGGSSFVIGVIMATASAATAITSARLGALTRRFSTPTLITSGFALYVVGLVLVPLMPAKWALVLPALLWGTGQGLNLPSTFTLLTDIVPAENRAGMLALNGTILRLGQTLGPLFGAGVYAFAGNDADAVYFVGAALAGAMALVLLAVFQPGRPAAG